MNQILKTAFFIPKVGYRFISPIVTKLMERRKRRNDTIQEIGNPISSGNIISRENQQEIKKEKTQTGGTYRRKKNMKTRKRNMKTKKRKNKKTKKTKK